MMRFVDVLYSLPYLFIVIIFATFFGRGSLTGLLLVIGAVGWLTTARIVRGQTLALKRREFIEAARATGVGTFGILLRHVIPNLVNSFISLFKDTSLVSIVALFDLLGSLRASFSDPKWSTPSTAFTGFAFAGIIYFLFCFGMSRYSLFVERRLNAHRRN